MNINHNKLISVCLCLLMIPHVSYGMERRADPGAEIIQAMIEENKIKFDEALVNYIAIQAAKSKTPIFWLEFFRNYRLPNIMRELDVQGIVLNKKFIESIHQYMNSLQEQYKQPGSESITERRKGPTMDIKQAMIEENEIKFYSALDNYIAIRAAASETPSFWLEFFRDQVLPTIMKELNNRGMVLNQKFIGNIHQYMNSLQEQYKLTGLPHMRESLKDIVSAVGQGQAAAIPITHAHEIESKQLIKGIKQAIQAANEEQFMSSLQNYIATNKILHGKNETFWLQEFSSKVLPEILRKASRKKVKIDTAFLDFVNTYIDTLKEMYQEPQQEEHISRQTVGSKPQATANPSIPPKSSFLTPLVDEDLVRADLSYFDGFSDNDLINMLRTDWISEEEAQELVASIIQTSSTATTGYINIIKRLILEVLRRRGFAIPE